MYKGDKVWVKQEQKPEQYKGKWTQTVWEVDHAPRYQAVSEWITTEGKTFWQATTNAPLPRREYTVRSDYNILKRGNRLLLTDGGWTHEQDNDKLLVAGTAQKLIAQEKGYNIYTKPADAKCAYAKTWWAGRAPFGVRCETPGNPFCKAAMPSAFKQKWTTGFCINTSTSWKKSSTTSKQ